MKRISEGTWLKAIVIAMASLSVGVGGLAIYGWHRADLHVIQIQPGLIPIAYNTAVALVVYGLGLFLLGLGARKVPRYVGAFAFLFGFGILLQFWFGEVGLDRPLVLWGHVSEMASSTRVPVGTAISLCFAGLALFLMTLVQRLKYSFLLISSLSALLIARSIMACFHYLVDVEMPMVWFHSMSIPSAIAFIFIGIGALAFITRERPPHVYSIHWTPITFFIGALAITFSFWQAQIEKDQLRIAQLIYLNALNISHQIKLGVATRLQTINHMSRTWATRGRPTQTQWLAESQSLLGKTIGFQAVGWIDPASKLQWLEFDRKSGAIVDGNALSESLADYAGKAIAQKEFVFGGPSRFIGGEPGFAAIAPIFKGTVSDGAIVGVFNQKSIFSTILNQPINDDFSFRVQFEDNSRFEANMEGASATADWSEPIPLSVDTSLWHLSVAPTEKFLDKNRSYLAEFTLITGLLLSMLMSVIIYFLQSVRRRARALQKANAELQTEITLRKTTQNSFVEQSDRLQSILDAMGDGVMVVDQEGRVILVNPMARRIMRADIGNLKASEWGIPADIYKADKVTLYNPSEYPIVRASKGETVYAEEMLLRFKESGDELWVVATTSPIRDESGAIKGAVSVFRDVTDIKRSEEILRKHERSLADAQHIAQIGSWEWDIRTNVVTWSDEMYRIYGLKPEMPNLSYDAVINFIHPDDRDAFKQTISKAYADKASFDFMHRVVRPDGDIRILQARGEVIKDENGQAMSMIGTGQDITERKKAEEVILRSQTELQKLGAIVESSNDAIIGIDLDGMIVNWNKGAEKIFGYTEEEVRGQSFATTLLPSRSEAELRAVLDRIQRRDVIAPFESVRMHKDGRSVHVSVTKSPIMDPSGKIVGVSVVARDISRRIEAEDALRESRELFHSFMNNSPTVAFMKDEEGKYVYVNRTFEELHKQQLENIKGKTDFDWLPDHVAAELKNNDEAAMAAGKMVEIMERVPIADGSIRDWWVFRFTVQSTGGKKFVCGVAVDVSERRKADEMIRRVNAELELRVLERTKELDSAIQKMQGEIIARKRVEQELAKRAEELAASNQELEHFALVASHDLQEPLRKISSYGQLLADRYKGRLDEKADRFIGYMTDGVYRMQNLIKGLLAYARVGKTDVQVRDVDLNEIFKQTLNDLESTIQEAGASVTAGALPTVRANPAQMGQLLQNLISNGLKFRRKEPPQVHVSAEQKENSWIIAVKDNGIGIEPQYIDRIFQIFQRLHTQKEFPGTGIGLAVCKKIVERHGGRMWVQSQKDHGATFFFSLPINVDALTSEGAILQTN